jgi:Inner membrane component of T3SS, cytoplasmic domain
MPKLVVNSGSARGREFELKPGINSLGRGFNCDFRLDDVSVSGSHAQIIVDTFSVTVKDLHSTNGTFINRSQIREGFLQPGQVISLGGVEMVFVADAAAENPAPTGSIARTVALPQIGGIKIARPGAAATPAGPGATPAPVAPAAAGGFRPPVNYPAPFMPAPSLTTTPTPVPAQQYQQQQQEPAPVPQVSVEARTWKHVEVAPPKIVGALRCFGFGAGAAVLSAAMWITAASMAGTSAAPYAAGLTGLVCGLAMRVASRNRPGAAFSLLAAGFGLLGMFMGGAGQVFLLQTVSFQDYNLVGLIAGLALAFLVGGVGSAGKAAGRAKFA